jgi:carbamoyl-phosphate synthase large subunit
VFKLVDTCAAEFEAVTPYYYSTYEAPYSVDGRAVADDEARVTATPKVVILGGGPNRIGQGIEFDYCCCQASFAAREMGLESVMINSNPETVSTDYDTSDLLFFEPLTLEDVLNVVERLNGGGVDRADRSGAVVGCIAQFGGQTPLNLAHEASRRRCPRPRASGTRCWCARATCSAAAAWRPASTRPRSAAT